jgi:hypothetical protein
MLLFEVASLFRLSPIRFLSSLTNDSWQLINDNFLICWQRFGSSSFAASVSKSRSASLLLNALTAKGKELSFVIYQLSSINEK